MKIGFSLLELTYSEFPVSLTGFGFAVRLFSKLMRQMLDTYILPGYKDKLYISGSYLLQKCIFDLEVKEFTDLM